MGWLVRHGVLFVLNAIKKLFCERGPAHAVPSKEPQSLLTLHQRIALGDDFMGKDS